VSCHQRFRELPGGRVELFDAFCAHVGGSQDPSRWGVHHGDLRHDLASQRAEPPIDHDGGTREGSGGSSTFDVVTGAWGTDEAGSGRSHQLGFEQVAKHFDRGGIDALRNHGKDGPGWLLRVAPTGEA
jgi:hypothetical protein